MLFDRQAKLALIVVAVTLVGSRIGFQFAVKKLNLYLAKEPVPLQTQLVMIPKQLETWRAVGEDTPMTAEMELELGTKHALNRRYIKNDSPADGDIYLHLAYYTGMIDPVPHVPDRCLVAGGWNKLSAEPTNFTLPLDESRWRADSDHPEYRIVTFFDRVTGRPLMVRVPIGVFELRTTEFSLDTEPAMRLWAGYFFIANGRTAATPWDVKSLAFRGTDRYAYYAKVQCTATLSAGEDNAQERFVDMVADLMNELLPELMQCLPDWAEIEHSAPEESSAAQG